MILAVRPYVIVVLALAVGALLNGGTTVTAATFEVPLHINGAYRGDLNARIGQSVAFKTDRFLSIAREFVRSDVVSRIKKTSSDGFTTLADLQAAGLDAAFNRSKVALVVNIAMAQRPRRTVSVTSASSQQIGRDDVRAADVSGYLTTRIGQAFTHSGDVSTGRDPFAADVSGAVRIGGTRGVTFEGDANVREGSENLVQRGDIRAVYDDVANAMRYAAGDIRSPSTGYQTSTRLAGLAVRREFDMQPYRSTSPSGRASFQLEEPSRVEILVNNVPVRTLRLGPGRYDLQDFPFVDGVNDVRVRIEGPTGETRELSFTRFFDANLLKQGLHEFGYTVGVPGQRDGNGITYDFDRPVFSGFHRYGLSSSITIGANAKVTESFFLTGLSGAAATSLGRFSMDAAASQSGTHAGVAGGVNYQKRVGNGSLDLSVDWRGQGFQDMAGQAPNRREGLDLAARYSFDLPAKVNAAIDAGYTVRDDRREWSAGVSLSRRFDRFSIAMSLTGNGSAKQSSEVTALVNMSVPLNTNQNVTLRHDTDGQITDVSWSRSGGSRIGDWSASAGVQRRGRENRYNAEASGRYTGNRFVASLRHGVEYAGRTGRMAQNRTRLSAGTSLAFADGHVAMGRPIDDAFALVHRHESLEGKRVQIEPDQDGQSRVETDFLGPAVIPDVASYRENRWPFDVANLEAGYALSKSDLNVTPPYRGGVALEVGSGRAVSIVGSVAYDGAPVSRRVVKFRRSNGKRTQTTFTNGDGRFALQGVRPGQYVIRLERNGIPYSGTFTVPGDARGYTKIGHVDVDVEDAT